MSRVPEKFHNGKWNETDDWMEEHPTKTLIYAGIILMLILGGIAGVLWLVFH